MQSVTSVKDRGSGGGSLQRTGKRVCSLIVALLLSFSVAVVASEATAAPAVQTTTCTVVSASLNLRAGPATTFAVVARLAQGAQLNLLARTTSGWLRVETLATPKRTGYVNGAAQYVSCATTDGGTPAGSASGSRRIITPPGDGDGVDGFIVVDDAEVAQGTIRFRDQNDAILFTRAFWLRAEGNPAQGERIEHVEFGVRSLNYFDPEAEDNDGYIYTRRESTDGYCLFGGGEPDCTAVALRSGATWPGTDHPIYNGTYSLDIGFLLAGGDGEFADAQWQVTLILNAPALSEAPGAEGQGAAALEAAMVEYGAGSDDEVVGDSLVLRMTALDPGVGFADGDGIESVRFEIFDPDGTLVYSRREQTAAYCAFAGGEPTCNRFDFSVGETLWPNSEIPVQAGSHQVRVMVTADDGRFDESDWFFEVDPFTE